MPTPPTPEYCPTNRRKLAEVQALLQEYDTALKHAISTGDFDKIEALQVALTTELAAVEASINPFEELLNLTEQYNQQLAILRELTDVDDNPLLINHPETGREGVIGVDGLFYPIPTQTEVTIRLMEQYDLMVFKIGQQQFTQLQLTPLALPLARLAAAYGKQLVRHATDPDGEGLQLLGADGNPVELDLNQPLYLREDLTEDEMIYYPQRFEQTNHGGYLKPDLLQQPAHSSGWKILLTQADPRISRSRPAQAIGGRYSLTIRINPNHTDAFTLFMKQRLPVGQTIPLPQDYLAWEQSPAATDPPSPYRGETIQTTTEDSVMRALIELKRRQRVMSDFANLNTSDAICYNLGTYMPKSGFVGGSVWDRVSRRACLRGFVVSRRYAHCSSRSAVSV